MALSGSQKAYKQARSGIARSGASRSNYLFPLYGVISVNGYDLTHAIQYGTLKISTALNEEPDTCSFDVMITDSQVQSQVVVGADVIIGLGGPINDPLFGGRILTAQTAAGPGHTPSVRSVMCADYLQVLDSEYLVTYDWPAQSATITILDIIARFTGKNTGAVGISTGGVQANLPAHAAIAITNERISTVLRRLVTMFANGGGFYVDPLRVLHVWEGASEPGQQNPAPLTLVNPALKAFAETVDNSQVRDACLVEGVRTTAPLGSPGPDLVYQVDGRGILSIPVADARIINPDPASGIPHEVRIGTQRIMFLRAEGAWTSPAGTTQTTIVTTDVAFNPNPGIENNTVTVFLQSIALFTNRAHPWILIDDQYLQVISTVSGGAPYVLVPRTGYGAMIGPIKANAVVTVVDSLGDGYVTQRYDAPGSPEQVRPQPIDSDVVMTVRSASGPAIHEHFVQDGRYARQGAFNRGVREIGDFNAPIASIQFETDDLNARPGRLQAYNLADPGGLAPLTGQYMILTAELTWPVWGQPPRRSCHAAAVQAADVTEAWVVDPR